MYFRKKSQKKYIYRFEFIAKLILKKCLHIHYFLI